MVHTPAEDKLVEVAPLATLLDQGWRNTRGLLDSEEFEIEQLEHEGHSFTCVFGDSVFTASMALFLPEAVAKWQPDADLSEGIIFSIPYRNQLNFAAAQPAASALGALMLMWLASMGTGNGGAMTPHHDTGATAW